MEDLQSLLEKINREGVEKAEANAAEIESEARSKAAEIIAGAKAEAEKTVRDAEKRAGEYAERAAETIRQSARDTVMETHAAITKSLEKLLAGHVAEAMNDEAAVRSLVTSLIASIATGGEIVCSAKVAAALAAELAGKREFKVITDESLDSGFTVKIDGGRIEHSFTAEAVAGELAKHLRPDLAALLR